MSDIRHGAYAMVYVQYSDMHEKSSTHLPLASTKFKWPVIEHSTISVTIYICFAKLIVVHLVYLATCSGTR